MSEAEAAPASSDLVPIGHAYGPMEAAIAYSMLDAAGILVHVQTRNMGCNAWHYMVALGGMAVLVPPSEAEAAAEILSDFVPSHRRRWPLAVAFLVGLASLWAFGVPPPASGFYLNRPQARMAR